MEDVILNKAHAEELIAQNPEASQKHNINDFKSPLEEATLTPAGRLMSEIDLLETSTRDQLESLQVAVAQQQIYETELRHLSYVINEAQKKMQASPINAASVGELRQLMADRTVCISGFCSILFVDARLKRECVIKARLKVN